MDQRGALQRLRSTLHVIGEVVVELAVRVPQESQRLFAIEGALGRVL